MPKRREKAHFPQKTCTICARPFVWRKKWARVWETIETCSDRCRGEARRRRIGRPDSPA
ncbi:DUF2256 domain-containing protein [Ancylobacter lacus]|uniref:DUF2256 domain-containing protein n=1 Tax=Ancylobacter lacus TaxID=2579970 RepID=UPI001BD06D02|nr:DUF2256 domain-containing protein [Ancylobacter lacus]